MAYSNQHFSDAWNGEYGDLDQNEPSAPTPCNNERDPFISVHWLSSKQNWPDHATDTLRDFMVKNDFYNFRTKCGSDVKLLEDITRELRRLFNTSEWVAPKHDDLLKEKIKHKMHRVRAEVKLGDLRKALGRLESKDHQEALELVFARISPVGATSWLAH